MASSTAAPRCVTALAVLVFLLFSGLILGQDEDAAQRLLLQAERFEQQGNVENALEEYGVLVTEFPKSSLAPLALLRSANLLMARGDSEAAFATAQKVIDDYGRDPTAAAAWLLQGNIRFATASDVAQIEEAQGLFRRVPLLYPRDVYPDLASRTEALVRTGEMSIFLGQENQAAAALLQAIEDEPDHPFKGRARIALAAVWLRQGEWLAAAELLQRVVDRGATEGDAESTEDRAATRAARDLLTSIHRSYVLPQASRPSWTKSRNQRLEGLPMKRPSGVAAGPGGRLLAVDDNGDQTAVFEADGRISARGSYRNAGKPWFGLDGVAYVPVGNGIQEAGGSLLSFTLGGEKPKPLAKLSAGQRGVFDDWLLVDREVEGVAVFDRQGAPRGTRSAGGALDLEDVALDDRGRLHVLDRKDRRVVVVGLDRQSAATFSGGWRRPVALDVDPLGNVYVLDRGQRTISVLRSDGRPFTTLGPTLPGGIELRDPEDLAVDDAGRIFIADSKSSSLIVVE